MVWSFEEAEAYLKDTAPQGKSVYGLGRTNHLLALLGRPQDGFPCVTIAGTNGKGSVLAFMESVLRAHGLKVACHVKPHLESVTERIRLNGSDSTPDEFAEALREVKQAIDAGWDREDKATYFELIFAAFLCAARSGGSDIALLEAGLGGRLDAVNAVDAPILVLTSVGLDHTELLGDSLESITKEKIAIARPGALLVCQVNSPEVIATVRAYAAEKDVRLVEATGDCELAQSDDGAFVYPPWAGGPLDRLTLGLGGPYQPVNAGLALLALQVLASDGLPGLLPNGLREEATRVGLREARLPGRWEKFRPEAFGPLWILDGAHNPSGLDRVLKEFGRIGAGKGTVVFGMKKDKKAAEVIPLLLKSAAVVVFVRVPEVECHAPEDLAAIAAGSLESGCGFSNIQIDWTDSISEGLEIAADSTSTDGTILVTGSLYLVGSVRTALRGKKL